MKGIEARVFGSCLFHLKSQKYSYELEPSKDNFYSVDYGIL